MGIINSQFAEDDDLRTEEFEELEQMSGFTREEIRKLYRRFKTLDRAGDGTLGMEDLLRVPEVAMNPLVDRIVGYFGFGEYAIHLCGKKQTRVNFTDFVRALSLFNERKSREEILEHVFRAFDLDGDGKLSREEFCSLVQSLVGKSMERQDVEELVDAALSEDDTPEYLTFSNFSKIMLNSSFMVEKNRQRTESSLEAYHRKRERELKLRG